MQPYFLPYLGYFQLMAKVDAFVPFDDVHFINRGWINRNRIQVNDRECMLRIPLQHASQNRLICDIDICPDPGWRSRMLKSIRQAYARAPQLHQVMPWLELIIEYPESNLAAFLHHSLLRLCEALELPTQITGSSKRYGNAGLPAQERIIDICQQEQAHTYINPIGGAVLYAREAFAQKQISLQFLNPTLQPYQTHSGVYLPGLSIVDVMMYNPPQALQQHLQSGWLS